MLQPFIFSIQRRPFGKLTRSQNFGSHNKKKHCLFLVFNQVSIREEQELPFLFILGNGSLWFLFPNCEVVFPFPSNSLILGINFCHSFLFPIFGNDMIALWFRSCAPESYSRPSLTSEAEKGFDRGRTRTCNPQIRSLVPYPLGHTAPLGQF